MKVKKSRNKSVKKRQVEEVIGLTFYTEYYMNKNIRCLDKRNTTIK